MRPLFLAAGQPVPPRSLVVDCGLVGAASYSHWQGAPATPELLKADSSTAILLNAARDPSRWLASFDWVVNDHIDADGLLALTVACDPKQTLPFAERLIGAAEAGDFCAWPGEAAYRLMLAVHQHIRSFEKNGGAWQQALVDHFTDAFEQIVSLAEKPDDERDRQTARVMAVRAALVEQRGFDIHSRGSLISVAWDRRVGHPSDGFLTVDTPDDLPGWAWSAVANDRQFQLAAMRTSLGTVYQLDAPRHSWARVVQRPMVAWPDFSEVAAILQMRETAACRWVAGTSARQHGFTCVLTSINGDSLAPSHLPIEDVINTVAQLLATNPA
jgi:hypothetical protein